MEETSFARYTLPREGIKRSNSPRSNSSQNLVVHAHLCEVSRLEAPQEDGRNPTWFSPEKSIRRLRKHRPSDQGDELALVVGAAVDRVRGLLSGVNSVSNYSGRDALRKVEFEVLDSAHAANWMGRVAFLAYAGRSRRTGNSSAIELALQTYLRRVLRNEQHQSTQRSAGTKKHRLLIGETTKPTPPSGRVLARVQRIDEPTPRNRSRSGRE